MELVAEVWKDVIWHEISDVSIWMALRTMGVRMRG